MNITKLLPIPLVALALVATSAHAADKHEHGFQLTGKTLGAPAQIDLGAPGLSQGDEQVITMDVFQGAKRLGESHVLCTIVRVDPATHAWISQCTNVTSLPGGDIVTQGVVTSAQEEQKPFAQAITGGTGSFRGAKGQLTVSEAGPQPATLTYDLD
jgi:hypothetical protein